MLAWFHGTTCLGTVLQTAHALCRLCALRADKTCFVAVGEVLEVQAASNNTIKGGFTAKDEPTDKEGLVAACTGGLLQASGQANSPALQAGVSISGADAAANFTNTPQGQSPTSGTHRIHEGPPREIKPWGLGAPGVAASGAQMLRLYQPEVDEFQVGCKMDHRTAASAHSACAGSQML